MITHDTHKIVKYDYGEDSYGSEPFGSSSDVQISVIPVLATIDISPLSSTKIVGNSQIFTATAKAEDDSAIPGVTITWSSTNPSIGTVVPTSGITDSNGQTAATFSALSAGSTVIYAFSGDVANLATVTVTDIQEASAGGAGIIMLTGLGITVLMSMKKPMTK